MLNEGTNAPFPGLFGVWRDVVPRAGAGKALPAARFTQAKPALIDASLGQMLVLSPRPHLQSG